MKREFGATVDLVPGSGGIFDVEADGRRLWSKHETGRFPDNPEVLAAARRAP